MAPTARRALLIGLLGPAIQALGFTWTVLHLAIAHWSETFGPRHLLYEPGVLLVIVGLLLTAVCVPVAVEVAQASPDDLEIPDYEPSPESSPARPGLHEAGGRLARYSTGRMRPPTGQGR